MRKPFDVLKLKTAALAAALLTAAGLASAATTVNLTAQRALATLPDGSTVPMWGYCGAVSASDKGAVAVGGGCPATAVAQMPWAPGPTIVVQAGDTLAINLTNNLPAISSLTIVGQLASADLGLPSRAASPTHSGNTTTTWPVVATGSFTPPSQVARARAFGAEVAGLGGTGTYSWAALRPGTYIYEAASRPSLQVPMGLYGVIIVTASPVTTTTPATPGQAYPATATPGNNVYGVANAGIPYDADATFLLSEIDPAQNAAVDAGALAMSAASAPVLTSGVASPAYSALEARVWNDPTCATTACYPAAVNYRPVYFLINGAPYDATNPTATAQIVSNAATTGNVLVRFANAGSRLHVPTFNGLQMALVSEDGNLAPGLPKVQSEVNLPPGRTADALIQPAGNGTVTVGSTAGSAPTAYNNAAYSLFDRALSLAGNNQANAGMHSYLAVAPAGTTNATLAAVTGAGGATIIPAAVKATSLACSFSVAPNVLPNFSATVAATANGCAAATAAATAAAPANGTVSWNGSTFTYTPTTAPIASGDAFTTCTAAGICTSVTLTLASEAATITAPATAPSFTSVSSSLYRANTRMNGVLAGYTTSDNYDVVASAATVQSGSVCSVLMNADGSFSALSNSRATASTCVFTFTVTDPRNPTATSTGTATVNFPSPSNVPVTVADALNPALPAIGDYMWIIEEDQTIHYATPGIALAFDPSGANGTTQQTLATSFHQSHMPVIAVGCTGPISCGDGAGGQTIQGAATASGFYSSPADVHLDPTRYYFISVLPGDAANPVINGYGGDPLLDNTCLVMPQGGTTTSTSCGHSIGGAPITPALIKAAATAAPAMVTVKVEPNPLRPAALSIYIFEDNSPTNNDYDANEVGLGGFEILVNDVAGRSGDPVGQITYDAYNMPLTNSLLGVQGCPNEKPSGATAQLQTNLVGVVYTCPDGDRFIDSVKVTGNLVTVTTKMPHQFGSSVQGANPTVDISGLGAALLNGSFPINVTGTNTFTFANPGVPAGTSVLVVPSSMARDATTYQLAGQALINNIMPGRYDVVAHPAAWREGQGETWYQVSTLEGTPGQDAFTKSNEPNYFQEFGPPGFHTFIGWINPAHLADQNKVALAQAVAAGQTATTVISGRITSLHMSRTVMETLWDSATNASIAQSNCFVGLNQTGETGNDIAFTPCDANGNFTLPAVPSGQQYELVIWDQWLDQIIAFKNLPANQVAGSTLALGDIPVFSWFTRVETSLYLDLNGNGMRDANEPPLVNEVVTIHFRDGSVSNILTTDGNGNAVFNELFPLFNWYVIESDQTRYNGTGVEVIVDAGGAPDCVGYAAGSDGSQGTINTAVKCPADIGTRSAGVLNSSYVWTNPLDGSTYGAMANSNYGAKVDPNGTGNANSTHRVDPDTGTYDGMFQGLQTFINQTEVINWGRRTFHQGENGGLSGMVVYTSTRGFDDPSLEVQFMWEPGIPRVKINVYLEVPNADGTMGLKWVNSTTSTSWDDWANLVYGSDGKQYMLVDNTLRDPLTGATVANLADPANTLTVGKQVNMTCPGQDGKDPYLTYALGTNNQFKCYDGFHLWNQVQPAVFDGYWSLGTDSTGAALQPGTYVVEVVPPTGYEIVKEEDKNILIGDAWVAPPAQQFGALSNIFIMPDQASLASAYNPANPGGVNTTANLGFVGQPLASPKCVGTLHQVPDYLSLFPASGQISPFAGAMRNLCDRKEVVLTDQESGTANFFLFTNTPRASHFTGLILDDAAAEINNAAPDFGEKFAASYAPVSLKDFNGVEILRVYSDQWGTYNGLAPSTWQVNVPNPAGYSPNMLVDCMNDPGPILDTRQFLADGVTANPTYNTMITDPLYNPSYSNFCYTNPFMPGMTVYLDTPVLPVAAFAAGYNPPDCALPAATPAIARVDSSDGIGPWVAAADGTHSITIKALGDQQVPNPNYAGPSGTTAPYNTRSITRHYGFGSTQGNGTVSVNGVALNVTAWSDTQITATVPVGVSSGELAIVASNGAKSVDTVTLTVGGAKPVVVEPVANASAAVNGDAHPIQDAIDKARPGDLIIVDAGNYPELVVMWKPVRLQGVGAASTVINAAKYPTQKLQNWRPRINALFGVDTVAGNQVVNSQVDPLPNQEITGGIVLLEPSVLATEEGAGITVLAKNPASVGADGLPNALCPASVRRGTRQSSVLTASAPDQVLFPPASNTVTVSSTGVLMSDSNFTCAPSRIDGIAVTGSDAGGGIYVNGWAHGLEIANTRVYGNAGSFNGGIRVGIPYLEGTTQTPVARDGTVFAFDVGVHIHHNLITNNGTVEANPGAVNAANSTGVGGGLSICTGTDNYLVNYNFICGNYSSGDGGGIGQTGVSNNGVIAQNTIVFNQSYQQTAPVHGGGIVIEGEVGAVGGLSLGTGSVTIDGNLIRGNFAQGGNGGGIRLQQVNGSDVGARPRNPENWFAVTVTNNMITNNVSGWGGGGISAVDALAVNVSNNTIANNDSVGIVGTMIGTDPLNRGTPLSLTTGYPSPAGVSVDKTTTALLTGMSNAAKASYAYAKVNLYNDVIWHNRSFFFAVTPQAIGTNGSIIQANTLCPSNSVADAYAPGTSCKPLVAQTAVGQCVGGAAYWDLGTTDDASAAATVFNLNPTYSVLSATTGTPYTSATNNAIDPGFVQGYCNGARANPAFIFEPGQPFLTPAAQNLTAGATLDEAGNFVDVRFGPLYLVAPEGNPQPAAGTVIGDYHLAAAAGGAYNAGGAITGLAATLAHDIDGDPRPQTRATGTGVDVGADEFVPPGPQIALATGGFPLTQTGSASTATFTVTNTGNALPNLIVGAVTFTGTNANLFSTTGNTCPAGGLLLGQSCAITVQFLPLGVIPSGGAARSATINVASNATNGTVTAPVNATAEPPMAQAAPTTLTFTGAAGSAAITGGITVTNTGYGPITVTVPAALTGSGRFANAAGGSCVSGTPVAVGGSCTVNVAYTPAGFAATNTGNAVITESANLGATATVVQSITTSTALSGTTFTPTATVSSPTAFGGQLINTTSAAKQVTVTNTSVGSINVTGITLGGATGQYQLGSNTCGTLAVGGSCTVNVSFAPTSTGTKNGTLNVSSNGTLLGTSVLSGTGQAPVIALSGTTNLGTGATGSTTLTLTNSGTYPLTVSSLGIAKTNGGNGAFSITGGSCAIGGTVAANGGTCTIAVSMSFNPGNRTSTTAQVTLSGVAQGTTAPTYTATRNLSGS